MVAIEAASVAVARDETSFEGGMEVQLKPSRWVLFEQEVAAVFSCLSGWATF
jgi:hypothetical protein